MTAPAAPVLVNMVDDPDTQSALLHSHLLLTDSGLLVILWNLFRRDHVIRVSGLEYLNLLLQQAAFFKPGCMLWIMPNAKAQAYCLAWLRKKNYPVEEKDFYIAPFYRPGRISDERLMAQVLERNPKHIFIAIGGGVQERLGSYLQDNFPGLGIHCIGAAIGFLTGDQIRIPMWADAWRLGWIFRCYAAPRVFFPRYLHALKLIPLLFRYWERMPNPR